MEAKQASLTPSMIAALSIAIDRGGVYSGYNPGSNRPNVSASAIRGLERRGYVSVRTEPGGSLAATIARSGVQAFAQSHHR